VRRIRVVLVSRAGRPIWKHAYRIPLAKGCTDKRDGCVDLASSFSHFSKRLTTHCIGLRQPRVPEVTDGRPRRE